MTAALGKGNKPAGNKKRLMTIMDLEGMSFMEIKKLPIYRYGGDLYEKAVEMAKQTEEMERKRAIEACKIHTLEFVINYSTNVRESAMLSLEKQSSLQATQFVLASGAAKATPSAGRKATTGIVQWLPMSCRCISNIST